MTPDTEGPTEKGEVAPAPPPSKHPPLDFNKVEALRRHMMMNVTQMAQIFGVSRVSYNSWVKGGPIRRSNDKHVRQVLRQLLKVMTVDEWPQPEVIAMHPKQRLDTLLETKRKYE